jgi:hypothetical protein
MILGQKKLWVFPFEESKEIIETLKIQLSYLFKDSLKVKNIFDKNIDEFFKLNLSEKCIKILIEKNDYYEIDFLAQTFIDEIEKKEFLNNDIEYSILVEPKLFISDLEELATWGSNRLNSLINITSNISSLFTVLHKFVNEQGKPSDIKGLYYSSLKFSQIFEQLLNWIIEVKSTSTREELSEIKIHLADMASNIVEKLWDYPYGIKRQLEYIKEQELIGNKITNFDLNLKLVMNEEAHKKFTQTLLKLSKHNK